MRVLTFNLFGQNAEWEKRRHVVGDDPRRLDPDQLTLQETVVTDGFDQVRDLVGSDYQVVHSRKRSVDGMGITTVSRWPVSDVREVDLGLTPRTSDFPCTALMIQIDVPAPGGATLLVNHFPDWQLDHEYERERQAVAVARAVEALVTEEPRQVILAGDLDATPEAASMRFFTGKQSLDGMSVCYRDAWEKVHPGETGATFSLRNQLVAAANWDWPNRQIDHILVRCGEHGGSTLAITGCELAFTEPIDGVWASDHFAVVADVELPPMP